MLIALMLALAADRAPIETGNDLLQRCSSDATLDFVECVTYLKGVQEGAQAGATFGGKCIFALPDGVTMGQLRDMVVQHLQSHPATRHYPASGLTVETLVAAWPCQVRKTQ